MFEKRRVAITGMSVNTPLGDTLDGFLSGLLEGRSAITHWKGFDSTRLLSKIGGDLSEYNIAEKASSLRQHLRPDKAMQLTKFTRLTPWATGLGILMSVDAFLDAGLLASPPEPERTAIVLAGHNIGDGYIGKNLQRFEADPDSIGILYAFESIDTDQAACIADVLNIRGPLYTAGGACASGNTALRAAMNEIRHHGMDTALAVGPVYDFSPAILHAMGALGAISYRSFNGDPPKASRPFDCAREGFVPSHGGGVLVLEELEHARGRGARIYAELLGVELNSAATRMPSPSVEDEARAMQDVLRAAGVDRRQVDFISAHATSTQRGDLAEIQAIEKVFGDSAGKLKINAPKSILGHSMWSSGIVEAVAAILQMRAGWLHPSINIEQIDPAIDLDVCANRKVRYQAHCVLNNAFGFGGINTASLICGYKE